MEEWVGFYDKHQGWIFLLLSIPTSIIANRIDDYLKHRSITAKDRNLKVLLTHYRDVVRYKERVIPYSGKDESKSDDVITVFMKITFFPIAMALVLMLSADVFSEVYGDKASIFTNSVMIIMFPFLVYSMALVPRVTLIVIDSLRFNEYKSKTIARLKKLDGNPEDLDNIDREFEKTA